jgi:hypothetical protein
MIRWLIGSHGGADPERAWAPGKAYAPRTRRESALSGWGQRATSQLKRRYSAAATASGVMTNSRPLSPTAQIEPS